jgi:hypothetical protein
MQMVQTTLTVMCCPSRRAAVLHPFQGNNFGQMNPIYGGIPTTWFSGDYAANAGTMLSVTWYSGPNSLADGASGRSSGFMDMSRSTGICTQRSQVKMADVTDGASNTYLVGEKCVDPDCYSDGLDWGDDQSVYTGDSDDANRWAGNDSATAAGALPPIPDTAGGVYNWVFGSAHPSGFGMALCDGSVKMLSFTIDPLAHNYLGNRHDGQPIDAKRL